MDSKILSNIALGIAVGFSAALVLNATRRKQPERDLCYEEAISVYNSPDYNFKKYAMCKSMGIVKWREYQKQRDNELYQAIDARSRSFEYGDDD